MMLDPHTNNPHEILAAKEELVEFFESLDRVQKLLLGHIFSNKVMTEEEYLAVAEGAIEKLHGFSSGRWSDSEREEAVGRELRVLFNKISREFAVAYDPYRFPIH